MLKCKNKFLTINEFIIFLNKNIYILCYILINSKQEYIFNDQQINAAFFSQELDNLYHYKALGLCLYVCIFRIDSKTNGRNRKPFGTKLLCGSGSVLAYFEYLIGLFIN